MVKIIKERIKYILPSIIGVSIYGALGWIFSGKIAIGLSNINLIVSVMSVLANGIIYLDYKYKQLIILKLSDYAILLICIGCMLYIGFGIDQLIVLITYGLISKMSYRSYLSEDMMITLKISYLISILTPCILIILMVENVFLRFFIFIFYLLIILYIINKIPFNKNIITTNLNIKGAVIKKSLVSIGIQLPLVTIGVYDKVIIEFLPKSDYVMLSVTWKYIFGAICALYFREQMLIANNNFRKQNINFQKLLGIFALALGVFSLVYDNLYLLIIAAGVLYNVFAVFIRLKLKNEYPGIFASLIALTAITLMYFSSNIINQFSVKNKIIFYPILVMLSAFIPIIFLYAKKTRKISI